MIDDLNGVLQDEADHFGSIIQDLQERNKRYREALEFYAKRKNYKPEHYDENIKECMSSIEYDEGFSARKALEESK